MDRTPVDKALEAVREKVERDKAQAAMDAARAEAAQQAADWRESIYRVAIDDIRRQAAGKPPRPQPYDWTAWGRGFY